MQANLFRVIDKYRGLWLTLLLAPVAVNATVSKPAWDELFFLHNGVCVARSVWSVDLSALDTCLSAMAKSPIMAFLLLPAGNMQNMVDRLNIGPVMLALLCFGQILILAWLTLRLRIPVAATLIAAAGAILSAPLRDNGAPYLVDGLLALVITNMLLLMMAEWHDPAVGRLYSVRDGAFWALLLSIGVLSKLTFGFFVVLIVPVAFLFSLRRAGMNMTLIKVTACAVVSLPAAIVLLRYWPLYYAHAAGFSFGELSSFYDDHLGRWQFIRQVLPMVLPVWFVVAFLALWALLVGRLDRQRMLIAGYATAILLAYFFVASGSPNKDARFFWPVWLALPFCFAAAVRPLPHMSERVVMATTLPLVAALFFVLPAFGRFNLAAIHEAVGVLALLPENDRKSIQLATDDPYFNIETLLLARELNFKAYAGLSIDTVVYDIARKRTVDQSIARLEAADFVVGRFPIPPGAPEWTNRSASEFQKVLEKSGRPMHPMPGGGGLALYGLRR